MIQVGWSLRDVPLAPVGMLATGAAAARLAERVSRRRDLRGVVTDDVLVVLGTDLPWVDGAVYLGEPASGLYTDTRLQPDVPAAMLAASLRARFAQPVAWVPGRLPVGVGPADVFDARALLAFAESWR